MPVLTGIDILGIQSYIYASNRLRDVLAASWMVGDVTSCKKLAQWGLPADHVLLAAGGNAIVQFESEADARRWTASYTRWLLDTAPGLEAVIAHREYDHGRLAWGLKALQIELARAKLERRPSVPQLGLGVTASCAFTGLPANDIDDQGALVSSSILELRRKVDDAKQVWDAYLRPIDHLPGWETQFPDVLDLMGRSSGDTSLVGVVHIDGNRVGKKIEGWLDRCIDKEVDDAEVRTQYNAWSRAITSLGADVLAGVVSRVTSCMSEDKGGCVVRGTPYDLGFRLNDGRDDKWTQTAAETVFLPLRPILLGGDDLTFVCDGRIALDLAVTALQKFAEHPIPHLGPDGKETTLTACAGVALVKAHAPFRSSYQLADDLCRSAKMSRKRAIEQSHADSGCWIDWHIGSARPGDSVMDIRERQYKNRDKFLTMRPYPLYAMNNREQSWEWLDKELLGPGDSMQTAEQGFRGAKHWVDSRSRVKLLSSLVSDGGSEIARQLEAWKVVEDKIALPGSLSGNTVDPGFIGSQTPLRDAIELLDLHIRLAPHPRVRNAAPTTAITDGAENEEGR